MEHTIAQNKAPCFGGRAPLFSQRDLLRLVGPLLVAGATFVAGLHGTAVFLLLALCTASFLFFQMRGWQRQIPQSNAAAGQAEPRNDWHAFGVLTLVIASRSILFLGFNTYIPMYWHDVFGQSKEFGAMMLAFFCVCGVSSNVLGGFLALSLIHI